MTPDNKQWIQDNTVMLIGFCFIFFTILMQVLHWLKINVFKVVVLLGTFALALAFAGNDLVNFIGVPLAGYSSFIDFTTNGAGSSPDGFLMSSLLGPAKTPWYFLFGAGIIMVYALCTSKKAHNVLNKLRKQNDKWHSMNVFYSGNNTVLSISSTNNVLATLEETNTFEMPQDEDE